MGFQCRQWSREANQSHCNLPSSGFCDFCSFHSCKWFPILNSCKMVPQGSGSRLVESVLDFCPHSDWLAPKYWDLLDGDGLPVDLSLCKPLPTPLPPQRLHLEPHTHPSGLTVLCSLFSIQIFFSARLCVGFTILVKCLPSYSFSKNILAYIKLHIILVTLCYVTIYILSDILCIVMYT